MNAPRRRSRGYSLVIVLMTLGLITVSILSLFAYLDGSAQSTGELISKRRAFYVCDGMTRILGRIVSDYSKQATAPPTPLDTEAYIHARAGALLEQIIPDGYELVEFDVTEVERVGDRVPIPNGPFEGILARETDLTFLLHARSADDRFACKIEQTLALSEIGLFQFAVFGAVAETPLVANFGVAPSFVITGRAHANGTLCVGTDAPASSVFVRSLTAGGAIAHASRGALCTQAEGTAGQGVHVSNGTGAVFDPTPLTGTAVAARWGILEQTVDAPVAGWIARANTLWGGRVRDVSHGVGPLVVPVDPAAQAASGTDDNAVTQGRSLRFLVDPPIAGESVAERRTRIAYNADLRIIDGVWYLRDTTNPNNWPGIPIWSDHPGSAIDHVDASFNSRQAAPGARQIDVGQEDLRTALSWASTPRRFSYYGFDATAMTFLRGAGATLVPAAAVSYGLLERVAGPPVFWRPAVVTAQNNAAPPDPMTKIGACGAPCRATGSCGPDVGTYAIGAAALAMCGAGNKTVASLLAESTRGIFYDARLSDDDDANRVRPLLPTNFDVAAFQDALTDTTAGELGSYFTGGRTFNGMVWISSLWPGAWDGFAGGRPTVAAAAHGAIPFPLCSDSLTGSFDTASPALPAPIAIPSCAARMTSPGLYAGEDVYAWSNAVRVINARVLDPVTLPDGLTIATNLPLWVIGNANTTSDSALTAADAVTDEAVPTPWLPFLVGGDVVSLGSNAWNDAAFAVKGTLPDVYSQISFSGAVPDAELTGDWRMAVLTGIPYTTDRTKYFVDLKGALRFPEEWGALSTTTLRGAVAIGYLSVYAGRYAGDMKPSFADSPFGRATYPKNLQILFDHRMARIDRQPPGAVSFDVQSVRAWERR